MEGNSKIKITPRTSAPSPAPSPTLQDPVERPPLFRIKAKKSNYDQLLAQLTESQRRNRRLKKALIIGVPILLLLAVSIVFFIRPGASGANFPEGAQTGGEASAILKLVSQYNVVDKGVINEDQSIPDFLSKYRVPNQKIQEIDALAKSKEIFGLQAGREFVLLRNKDNERGIDYFGYEIDNYRYGVFQIYPEPGFRFLEKDIQQLTRRVSGIIRTNLFDAVLSAGLPYQILQKMDDALAWSVDFYHLKPGDKFKIIFDEKLADGQTMEIGQMRAIYFSANEREHYAFFFDESGEPAYFSDIGRPMKSTFLKSPLKYGRITSHFQLNRLHPVDGVVRDHFGTDYAAEEGTEIYAVADGVVEDASFTAGNGNYVKLKHDKNYQTQYLHMQKFAPGIMQGKRVLQGEVIGYVGQTGKATGPHVCFRFWKNGQQVDHTKEDVVLPVHFSPEILEHFTNHRDSLMEQLAAIQF